MSSEAQTTPIRKILEMLKTANHNELTSMAALFCVIRRADDRQKQVIVRFAESMVPEKHT